MIYSGVKLPSIAELTSYTRQSDVVDKMPLQMLSPAQSACGSILSGSFLSGYLLSGSFLSGYLLSGYLLSGSILSGSILSGSILSGSILSGSILSGSILSGSILSGPLLSGPLLSEPVLGDYFLAGSNRSSTLGTLGYSLSPAALAQATQSTMLALLPNSQWSSPTAQYSCEPPTTSSSKCCADYNRPLFVPPATSASDKNYFPGLEASAASNRASEIGGRPGNQCHRCGTTETPEWRRGPNGLRTLCNACGLFHAKLVKRKGAAVAAEEVLNNKVYKGKNGRRVSIKRLLNGNLAKAAKQTRAMQSPPIPRTPLEPALISPLFLPQAHKPARVHDILKYPEAHAPVSVNYSLQQASPDPHLPKQFAIAVPSFHQYSGIDATAPSRWVIPSGARR